MVKKWRKGSENPKQFCWRIYTEAEYIEDGEPTGDFEECYHSGAGSWPM